MAQIRLEILAIKLNGLLAVFEHELELFVLLEGGGPVGVDYVVRRIEGLNLKISYVIKLNSSN